MSEMSAEAGARSMPDQDTLPPVTEVCVASMILIVIGGIYMASHLPHRAPSVLPIIVIVGSAALILWNALSLSRISEFAWDSFWLVARWSLLAYLVIGGMLEYVFLRDGTRGSQLVLVTLMLMAYAINIPLLLAYSVARYQPPGR
jgi:hypothetical protein